VTFIRLHGVIFKKTKLHINYCLHIHTHTHIYIYIYIYIYIHTYLCVSRDKHSRYSDWLRAGRSRGQSSNPGSIKNCLFPTSSRLVLGATQPPIQWVSELSPGVKRPGREADYSPQTNADIKKTFICTTAPPYVFRS
jgi:hypothetical protein